MSDLDSIATPSIDWAIVTAQSAAREALATALLPVNKTALFDVLAAAAVTTVVVSFDGYGDSGQIESVEARAGDDVVDLPAITVTQAAALWDGSGSEESTPLLTDAIESLAHDLLTDTHAGWENNDGAYGEFVFDVANRTITLDHNDRYTAVESYSHVW